MSRLAAPPVPYSRVRAIRLVVLGAIFLGLAGMTAWILFFALPAQHLVCPTAAGEPVRPGGAMSWIGIGVCLAGLLAGHYSGQFLSASTAQPVHPVPSRGARAAVQVGIALVVLVAALALGYETIAVLPSGPWPITFYLRCAVDLNPTLALAGGFSLAFLIGDWLWYPVHKR